MDKATLDQHIDTRPDKCGGKPCVAGTRIRVWDIHVWHNLRGQTPEEIVATYPQLTVADVHAALAYYLDRRDEIDQRMNQAEETASQMQSKQGPTRFTTLRDELLRGREVSDDSLPS